MLIGIRPQMYICAFVLSLVIWCLNDSFSPPSEGGELDSPKA